jgi:hypothetical protein
VDFFVDFFCLDEEAALMMRYELKKQQQCLSRGTTEWSVYRRCEITYLASESNVVRVNSSVGTGIKCSESVK